MGGSGVCVASAICLLNPWGALEKVFSSACKLTHPFSESHPLCVHIRPEGPHRLCEIPLCCSAALSENSPGASYFFPPSPYLRVLNVDGHSAEGVSDEGKLWYFGAIIHQLFISLIKRVFLFQNSDSQKVAKMVQSSCELSSCFPQW